MRKKKPKILGHKADTTILDELYPIIPPKGPPTNLRPGGGHEDKKQKELNKILKKEIQDEQDSNS